MSVNFEKQVIDLAQLSIQLQIGFNNGYDIKTNNVDEKIKEMQSLIKKTTVRDQLEQEIMLHISVALNKKNVLEICRGVKELYNKLFQHKNIIKKLPVLNDEKTEASTVVRTPILMKRKSILVNKDHAKKVRVIHDPFLSEINKIRNLDYKRDKTIKIRFTKLLELFVKGFVGPNDIVTPYQRFEYVKKTINEFGLANFVYRNRLNICIEFRIFIEIIQAELGEKMDIDTILTSNVSDSFKDFAFAQYALCHIPFINAIQYRRRRQLQMLLTYFINDKTKADEVFKKHSVFKEFFDIKILENKASEMITPKFEIEFNKKYLTCLRMKNDDVESRNLRDNALIELALEITRKVHFHPNFIVKIVQSLSESGNSKALDFSDIAFQVKAYFQMENGNYKSVFCHILDEEINETSCNFAIVWVLRSIQNEDRHKKRIQSHLKLPEISHFLWLCISDQELLHTGFILEKEISKMFEKMKSK